MQAAASPDHQPTIFQADRITFIADDAFRHIGTLPSKSFDCVVLADIPSIRALAGYRPLAKELARILSGDGVIIIADRADVNATVAFACPGLHLSDAYECNVDGARMRCLTFSATPTRQRRPDASARHRALAGRGRVQLRDVVRDLEAKHGSRFYEPFASSPAIAAACASSTRISYEAHYRSPEALGRAKQRFLEATAKCSAA